jgi:antitoxin PrlF
MVAKENMGMPLSILSSKGQITLPARIRKKVGLKIHDRVSIETMDDSIIIRRVADIFTFEGFLGKALPVDQERKQMQEGVSAHVQGSDL